MSRNAFGPWGAGLPAGDFAAALAGAGSLDRDGDLLPWPAGDVPAGWSLAAPPTVPAERVAAQWHARVAERPHERVRLGLDAWPENVPPAWLVETLAEAPSVASAFVVTEISGRVPWSWPVQVTALGRGAEAFTRALAGAHWAERFVELVSPDAAGPCDVLLVTRGLRQGLPLILGAPVQASFVVFLEALAEPWQRARALLDAALADTGAGGAAFMDVDDPVAWFDQVLFELSHDQTLDVAMIAASRTLQQRAPLIAADVALLKETRMSQIARRFRERLAYARDDLATANGGGPPPASIERLEERVDEVTTYVHESEGATDLVELDGEAREVVPPPAPRFVQAQVFEHGPERPVRRYAFRTGALHELRVRVGPLDSEWAADPTTPLDERSLPPGGEHRLRVVLTEPHLLEEPQVDEVVLPERGASSTASFWLRTGSDEMPVAARIVVLHEGRILQTVSLRGRVRGDAEAARKRDLTVRVEALVHPFMALSGRTPFDAAFVVNEDRAGTERVTTITGTSVDISEPADLDVAFNEITAKLEELVTAEDPGAIGLRDDRMRELLVFLAVQGRSIYTRLVDVGPGQAIAAMGRIQILSLEPEKLFPLEFVYDSVPPDDDAEICPTAERELAEGALDTCPARTGGRYVCPLGFWGLRKVIERHAHDPSSKSVPEKDFRVSDWWDDVRKKRLRPFNGALFAASSRADKKRPETTAELAQRLASVVAAAPGRAATWKEWQAGVESAAPPLLVMLPHTLPHPKLKVPTLEIGEEQHVRFDKIDPTYVGAQWPIVFLLGCDTSEAPIQFQKFPTAFRQQHAGVVVATLTRVLGRNAGPVAGELVAEFAEQSKRGQLTFGDALRRVRCTLLAKGFPTVLTVVAFGDADWVFQPQEG